MDYDECMNVYIFFRFARFRELFCRARFLCLSRITTLRTSTNIENIDNLNYSRVAIKSWVSISSRVNYLVNKLQDTEEIKDQKLLVIGPRFESELFGYMSLGIKKKNLFAIDTFSYSKLISVQNMHEMNFSNESFDLIICGWTIAYSNNIELALKEICRVAKIGAKIIITFDLIDSHTLRSIDEIFFAGFKNPISKFKNIFELYSYSIGKTSWNTEQDIACFVLVKI